MSELPIRVCAESDLGEGEGLAVSRTVTGWRDAIAVFRDQGRFYALDDTCTHEQASLAGGWIEDGCVECPNHHSRFSLRTGEVVDLPATQPTQPHRIEVRDGQVWLYPGVSPNADA